VASGCRGKKIEDANALVDAACELEQAGVFSLVLEGMPAEVAAVVTKKLQIPTIGIGAGRVCDGQVLVVHDLLGMSEPPWPRFVAPYARLGEAAVEALQAWAADVRAGTTPTDEQTYKLCPETAEQWRQLHGGDGD
jgi:3-methyl-2-oxobutanoate hydroxymethyltransferase